LRFQRLSKMTCKMHLVLVLWAVLATPSACFSMSAASTPTSSVSSHAARPALKSFGRAGPSPITDPAPVYDDTGLLDRTLLNLFRRKVSNEIINELAAWQTSLSKRTHDASYWRQQHVRYVACGYIAYSTSDTTLSTMLTN
jgi:hypothetical protein